MDIVFSIEVEDNFKVVAEEIINNLFHKENNTNIINENVMNTAKEEVKDFIIKSNCDTQKIHEVLSSKGYEEDKIKFFSTLIKQKQDVLLHLTLVNFNSYFGETVTKFDWTLKLVHGTSELKKLKYPSFQLTLTTVNSCEYKQIGYDISKNMLNNMINALENINTM